MILDDYNTPIVLIDDDSLLRMAWEFAAKKSKKNFYAYSSPDNFKKDIAQFDKKSLIYIDSDLGNNIKGEVFALDLYHLGFTELYLATGYSSELYKNMPWLKSIVGKTFSF